MSDYVMSESVQSNPLVQAFIRVSQDVTEAVIQKASQTHTPVILMDAQGNIVRLDAKELAHQYGIED
jgi:fructose/tagatose bisphosphate aldolase